MTYQGQPLFLAAWRPNALHQCMTVKSIFIVCHFIWKEHPIRLPLFVPKALLLRTQKTRLVCRCLKFHLLNLSNFRAFFLLSAPQYDLTSEYSAKLLRWMGTTKRYTAQNALQTSPSINTTWFECCFLLLVIPLVRVAIFSIKLSCKSLSVNFRTETANWYPAIAQLNGKLHSYQFDQANSWKR